MQSTDNASDQLSKNGVFQSIFKNLKNARKPGEPDLKLILRNKVQNLTTELAWWKKTCRYCCFPSHRELKEIWQLLPPCYNFCARNSALDPRGNWPCHCQDRKFKAPVAASPSQDASSSRGQCFWQTQPRPEACTSSAGKLGLKLWHNEEAGFIVCEYIQIMKALSKMTFQKLFQF